MYILQIQEQGYVSELETDQDFQNEARAEAAADGGGPSSGNSTQTVTGIQFSSRNIYFSANVLTSHNMYILRSLHRV